MTTQSTDGRLVSSIDCAREYGPETYFGHGQITVVESGTGCYREAEGVYGSRFGYRFRVQNVGRPHEVVIRYPDDKRRFMCIMDGTCYDLSTGVLTGGCQPLSGQMLELRQVFWPRWTDASIVFMTWGEGEPAAVAGFDVYELRDLPPLELPPATGPTPRREFGIQYEDPWGNCAAEGARTRKEWIERVVSYARHTGQGSLTYPLVWYHGPLYPSEREPSSQFDWVVAPDRTFYTRWTSHPQDWYRNLLGRFGEEGLQFRGALTLLRLGSLMERMQVDETAIRAGAATCNNVLADGTVRAGTGDWTAPYDARFMTQAVRLLAGKSECEVLNSSQPNYPALLYGERPNPDGAGPMFNPLQPAVQEAILGVVREICARYGKYPAFCGISFNIYAASLLWFGSLRAGYDDYTIDLFTKETGIKVPGEPGTPERFMRRFLHLTTKCRSAWVDWRCEKIRGLVRQIRDAVVAARPDLTVTLTLWQETVLPFLFRVEGQFGAHAGNQLGAQPGVYEAYREGGIDWALFANEPGIELDLELGNPRDRGGHGSRPTAGVNTALDEDCLYRDHTFLDQRSLGAMAAQKTPGAFVFNCWVESWGRHVWFPVLPDDPNRSWAADMDGRPAEGLARSHSVYPRDGFWWEPQLRITPQIQGGVHFLEPYAHAVAELDACRITQGGLFLDKAHSAQLQQFARAFRALPREKFETVGTSTDPVAVRTLVRDGRRYVYLVNREYYPIAVELELASPPVALTNLATGDREPVAAGRWCGVLGPYELRTFAAPAAAVITSAAATPPAEQVAALQSAAERALRAMADARAAGSFVPGMDAMEAGIRAALTAGRIAWLRRALTGYVVRKCQLAKG